MTTFLLIRHGETDAVGKVIAGCLPGWHLNATGKAQVERLAQRLSRFPVQAVYTSPLERTIETATPIAAQHGLVPQVAEDLVEVRFGGWEGLTFQELENNPDWQRYNVYRSLVRPPGGELMIEIQTRMVRQLEIVRERHAGETVAIVSHGDPLRSTIMHFMGIPLDFMLRFEVSPASVSIVEWGEWGSRVLCVNGTGEVPT